MQQHTSNMGSRTGHAATVVMTVASSFASTETLIYLQKESICERLTAVAGPEMQDGDVKLKGKLRIL